MKSLIRPAIDLRHRHFERTKHGIVCIGTWLTDEKTGRTQPCLVLLHAARPISAGRTIPVIIALDNFWRYANNGDGTVGDMAHAIENIEGWLADGILPGSPHNTKDVARVLDAINDCLRDLVHMPPKPRFDAYAIGDIEVIDRTTGKTIAQHEVTN